MPEIFDIVQRINYEVESNDLTKATAQINKQVEAATVLENRVKSLEKALNETAKNDIQRRERLTSLITRQKKALEDLGKATFQQISTNKQLQKELTKTTEKFNSMHFAIGNIIRDSPSFAFGIKQGFVAIANNIGPAFDTILLRIKQLQAEGKATTLIFKEIGSSLFGLTGIVNLAVLGFTLFGDKLFSSGEQASGAAKKLDEYNKSLQEINDTANKQAAEEISKLNSLTLTAQNAALSLDVRRQAIEELRKLYPSYFKDLTDEEILNGKVADAVDRVTTAIIAKQFAEAAGKKAAEATLRQYNALVVLRSALKDVDEAQKALNKSQAQGPSFIESELGSGAIEDARAALVRAKARRNEAQAEFLTARKDRADFLADQQRFQEEAGDILIKTDKKVADKRAKAAKENNRKLRKEYIPPIEDQQTPEFKPSTDTSNRVLKQLEAEDKLNKERQKLRQKDLEEQQKTTKAYIDGFAAVTVAGLRAAQMINEAEISRLNRAQTAQERRVEQAKELALRGNADALKLEQDRLDAIIEKQQEAGRKQVAINALISASNSAKALTEAVTGVLTAGTTTAAEGGGVVGYVAAIIAGFAAVAGLYASVRSLTSVTDGYKKGGYTGDGDPNDTAGVVHKKEFVMPAHITADPENRRILEAMYAGTYKPQEFVVPASVNRASKKELKGVEERLDAVVEALQNNGVSVKQSLDAHGFSQAVETYQRKDRQKWS